MRLVKTDDGGDSRRVKFVLLAWCGEATPPFAKGRLSEHKALLLGVLQGTHITLELSERAQLQGLEAEMDAALKRAGGANYDLGNTRSGVQAGASASVKSASKLFFQQKDSETTIKGPQFEKQIRQGKEVMACDLGSRVMTASATEAKRNTVGYSPGGSAEASPVGKR